MNINSAPPSSPPSSGTSSHPPEMSPLPGPSEATNYASKSGPDRNKLDLSFHTFPFYSRDSSRAIVGLDPQFLLLSGFVENTVFFTRQSAHIVVICNILAATVFLSTGRENTFFVRRNSMRSRHFVQVSRLFYFNSYIFNSTTHHHMLACLKNLLNLIKIF